MTVMMTPVPFRIHLYPIGLVVYRVHSVLMAPNAA